MKKIILLALLTISISNVFSQTETKRIEEFSFLPSGIGATDGKIIIKQDALLGNLLQKSVNSNDKKFPGYRVQIYFGSGQSAMNASRSAKEKFMYKYGDKYGSYIIYESPYFKLRVGDFRTKAEALYFNKIISSTFPNSWVVPDRINYPENIE
jgi:hypothetical protein